MHIMALIDTKLTCLEYTLIELRNNLHISIETEVRTHIVRILILLSQQMPLLIVNQTCQHLKITWSNGFYQNTYR